MRKKKLAPAPDLPATSYYVLVCYDGEEADITRGPRLPKPLDNWMGGKRWKTEPPKDLVFEIDEDDEGTMIPFFDDVIPLMRADMLEGLRKVGVDNIDDYPAIVRETRTAREYKNYRAVNIIGPIRAADLAGSDASPSSFDGEFIVDSFFRTLKL